MLPDGPRMSIDEEAGNGNIWKNENRLSGQKGQDEEEDGGEK